METSENPVGAKIINNLTTLKYFQIATAIRKYLCLAACLLFLLFERNELIEMPLRTSHIQHSRTATC